MSIPIHRFIDRSRSISTVDKDSLTGEYGRYRRWTRIYLQRITVDLRWWIKIRDNFVVDFIDDTCGGFLCQQTFPTVQLICFTTHKLLEAIVAATFGCNGGGSHLPLHTLPLRGKHTQCVFASQRQVFASERQTHTTTHICTHKCSLFDPLFAKVASPSSLIWFMSKTNVTHVQHCTEHMSVCCDFSFDLKVLTNVFSFPSLAGRELHV